MKFAYRRIGAVLLAVLVLLVSATSALGQDNDGFVRFVHAIPGAAGVDVYADGQLVSGDLKFGTATEYVGMAAGDHVINVTPAGETNSLWQQNLAVESEGALTLIAASASAPTFIVFSDDTNPLDEGKARFTAIHAISEGPAVDLVLADGRPVLPGLEFGQPAGTLDIPEFNYEFAIVPAGGKIDAAILTPDAIDMTSENSYVLVVYGTADEPESLVLSSPIPPEASETISAPVAVEPTAAPTLPPPPTVIPTEVVVVAPTVAPTAVPVQPAGPTGRVFNMNADRNLQLRQYPNSDALSLGTVPPNTILSVNGRQGAIEEIPNSSTPVPPDYEFVDPASLLTDPKEDLDPEATWLNITYNTPDGGVITAWVSAQFIDLRNPKGEKMKLADLPLVATNLPGDVDNTAITGPSIPQNRVSVTVFNLDVGVNLNIRRTPETNGEVLARVPTGTIMEFVGLNEDQSWVFVSYSSPEGGTVTGWVNAEYLQYSFNNRAIDFEEMDQRGLLSFTPEDTRGDVTAGSSPVSQPTANPVKDAFVAEVVLDPGSNLNLRRDPDVNSEVLVQVPSGTQVLVTARTPDERWLNVTFEETEGWIAAQTDTALFVRLTKNGKEVEINEVPITGNEITGDAAATPSSETTTTSQATAAPTLDTASIPVRVTDVIVQMTGSPGGNADGLPLIPQGTQAAMLFTDGSFSYIQLEDGTKGWVPAGSVRPI